MRLNKEKIMFLMCEKGIKTQKELAEKIGVAPHTIVQNFYSANPRYDGFQLKRLYTKNPVARLFLWGVIEWVKL